MSEDLRHIVHRYYVNSKQKVTINKQQATSNDGSDVTTMLTKVREGGRGVTGVIDTGQEWDICNPTGTIITGTPCMTYCGVH